LYYNPQFGVFVWKYRHKSDFTSEHGYLVFNAKFSGKIAGSLEEGYLRLGVDGKKYLAHRLVWLYVHGEFPPEYIDHINGNGCDNRITNLRAATNKENSQNRTRKNKGCKSTLLGVHLRKDRGVYKAVIQVDSVSKYLGSFRTEQEAHEAYVKAKREIHPFNTI
jgi:hypothetical protein